MISSFLVKRAIELNVEVSEAQTRTTVWSVITKYVNPQCLVEMYW